MSVKPPSHRYVFSCLVSRELANKARDFIPDLARDNSVATLNFLTAELNMSSDSSNGDYHPGVAGAGFQIAGLAANGFAYKSGPFQFLADMRRNL